MEKSPEAFRTISEVADWLGVPTHVLRFWESRFSQIKPVKRAGGRRYYRPADMLLIGGIKQLLHDDGMTIRGVQKLLREEGVKHVAAFSQPIDMAAPLREIEDEGEEIAASPMAVDVEPEPVDNVVPLAPSREDRDDRVAAADGLPDETDAETEPADVTPEVSEPEDEPEFSFLRRDVARPSAPQATPPAGDLFTSRRSPPPTEPEVAARTAVEPPKPRIPATPQVPSSDPADDDPAFTSSPRLAARLLAAPAGALRMDRAVIAQAVADLRALRDRPHA